MNDAEVRYNGDWIEPDESDKGRREGTDHHKYWNKAIDNVVDKVPEGEEGPFDLHRKIRVKHGSPGWVDGYRVDLSK